MSHAERRARVLAALGDEGALVLAAAPELRVGRDTELRYAVDADLFYLTGSDEPETVIVLHGAAEGGAFTVFVQPRDAAKERWTGERGGVESAAERYGADQAFAIGELGERLPSLLRGAATLYARLRSGSAELDALLPRLLEEGRARRARHGRGIIALVEPGALLDDMRLVKDAGEIERIRSATQVTVDAFRDALAGVRVGGSEAGIEAAVEAGFRRRGASGPAFPSIVAAGANATVLHYRRNDAALRDGELLLVDAGARVGGYCADVTRTVPIAGRFADVQRRVYDVVLAARDAAAAVVRPGATIEDVHDAAHAVLLDGMLELGLIEGDPTDEQTRERARTFFPHRTSHWLGLDVHDVGDYVRAGEPRALAAGMLLTIEPGLYVPRGSDAPERLRGIGIRIEDDVLVTPDGGEILSGALPVDADAVEALIG